MILGRRPLSIVYIPHACDGVGGLHLISPRHYPLLGPSNGRRGPQPRGGWFGTTSTSLPLGCFVYLSASFTLFGPYDIPCFIGICVLDLVVDFNGVLGVGVLRVRGDLSCQEQLTPLDEFYLSGFSSVYYIFSNLSVLPSSVCPLPLLRVCTLPMCAAASLAKSTCPP